ncbi:M23 family metallopeptidase [Flavobacterium beibuense]|uniref:Peptidase, M23/M37 family protein n=1 Tax=Flavobacterium beibuense TaxID=657326 RepID=A0A444W6L1_9FLAO|nr:peptidoglycan DD-metalloendopeptidase family protein [Flavobacterium beibuense]RYJ41501.1 Peptidase, M23/M37 family protein [Flavobacterium beibuense]
MRYLTFILLLTTLIACNDKKEEEKIPEPVAKKEVKIIKEFGFVVDSFQVVHDTIRSGDTFGALLAKQNFDAVTIHNITQKIRDTFNLRDIRVGKPYTLFKDKNAPNDLKIFVYEPDKLSYYVVDLRDSVVVHKKKRPVTVKRRIIAGEIEGSLAGTLDKEGVGPAVAQELSEIYAWSVDFFRIQKGDKFGVIINETYISDTIYAGIKNIEASFFEYKGDKIYAFPFKQDTLAKTYDYYDQEGKALKSMFLKAPLKFSRISSRFSPKRFHPVQKRWKAHNGTDYAAPTGTPIMATAHGVVERAGYTSGNGNYVKIKHNNTYSTQYLHMSKILVRTGQRVSQGQIIGKVGSTGLATGPHVCYRFWKNGVQVDALKQKFTSSEPMKKEHMPRYEAYMQPLKKELDSISNLKFNNNK